MRRLSLFLCLCLLAACPRSGGSTGPSSDRTAALTLPPGPGTLAAVRALEAEASAGDANAAWDRAHYLLDLFDDARFRGDARSRAMLWEALGDAPANASGPAATDRAAAALISEVEEVLALDRLHRGASSARVLLEMDRAPRIPRADLLRRMLEVKAAGTVESVAGNAALRLAGYCVRALDDATRGPTRRRALALAHCLYPLYEADPAPYFAGPDQRPPLPRWQDLVNRTGNLLEEAEPLSDRLVPALSRLRSTLDELRTKRADALPVELDPAALELPASDHAEPYDWTPLATAASGALTGPLEGDGRGVIALPLPAGASRAELDAGLDASRAAGAAAVDLLVSMGQTLDIPEGDYWSQRGGSATIRRAGAVRVALSTTPGGDATPNLGPKRALWDPARARLGLHLIIEPSRWLLTSANGDLVSIKPNAPKGDPRTELRVALARVRQAFADEAGLVLVLDPAASYPDLVRAATAAARDDRGRPSFTFLAFGKRPPVASGRDLATRVERRRRAVVQAQPRELASRAGAIRTCYQTLLETMPELTADVRVEAGEASPTSTGAGADEAAACVTAATRGSGLSGTVRLAPRPR